ncbi:DAGAT-domain-containing protein [Lentinus tigrinus ALCF2SS1-7]|uniref:Diacylglycerol O-acyltransferase n=1 Tax=Lentinus tigrinus ALCF2SS1-6 TaxID=1328759 RepID=A0A5C2S6Y1_9APHY|nr:DAGAT-domain-containing protein [Lentinus tigrinus ALCF2SS1-6]RPD73350.1 DAGAT-domain-containing protein [Lentinus tigrinus ALCF2SS1-7]
MEVKKAFTSATRTVSSSSLRERLSSLSSLTATPLKPVKNLQAHIEFAPSKIPRKRRLQTLAVAIWSTLIALATFAFVFLLSFPPLWPFLAAYWVWIAYIDKSPEHGGRMSPWFRSLRFWRYFADYYPASFLKTCDLPPDRPYVFGYHPHGIIGMGATCTFATESTGFSAAFPGIIPHLLTLASNFRAPFYRDIILAMGICSVSKQSCSNILKGGPGQAITIVVGGAAESLSAHPGTADLTLRKRLGFIKVAIQHGADLVPVFSFGENDIYRQMPNEKGTTLYSLQKKFQNMFGFTLPLFHGRGLLNYNLGLMPYRRRIVAVIGHPIHVVQCDKPSLQEIMHVQQQYIDELMWIWHTYKDEFARTRKRELSIIE